VPDGILQPSQGMIYIAQQVRDKYAIRNVSAKKTSNLSGKAQTSYTRLKRILEDNRTDLGRTSASTVWNGIVDVCDLSI
jgi:hypothetical protein